MARWPDQPVVYEVNTWVWLNELTQQLGRRITLADIPSGAWDEITVPGVDAVWLMGVWERSPVGRRIALADETVLASCRRALPDLRPEDVIGSPYCVRRYVVDHHLGGPGGLAVARQELARRGVRLLLDYVPNHAAPDHPWLEGQPDLFIRGSSDHVARAPDAFLEWQGNHFARGGHPWSPPWRDVVQLDAFSSRMRQVTVETLLAIGEQCDGVRCDMAMLLVNEAFGRTWGELAGSAPAEEFWPHVLGRVRSHHPHMLFVAEVYGELDWALQQQGFDYCYDKTLYDRLVGSDASSVRVHLQADPAFQRHLARFLENHDEPRAAATIKPVQRECAAAVALATVPGLTLWHEGQFDGRHTRLPVFLARRPFESQNKQLRRFHLQLLNAVNQAHLKTGEWRTLDCNGWPDNQSCRNLMAWCWQREGQQCHLVVINLSDRPAQGRLPLPWPTLRGRSWRMTPILGGDGFDRDGNEMVDPGLFVALAPWDWHILALQDQLASALLTRELHRG